MLLEIRDLATDTPMLSIGDAVLKFLGVTNIGWDYTGAAKSGTIVDDRINYYPGSVPQVIVLKQNLDPSGGPPTFTFSGNVLTWEYPQDEAVAYKRGNTTFAYCLL